MSMRLLRAWAVSLSLALVLPMPRPAAALWPDDPSANVPLSTAPGDQMYPEIVSDGAGGAIVTWYDTYSRIYAQRISADGAVQWTANGVVLCTYGGSIPAIASDGASGAIVTWQDYRSGNNDIYAQRISAAGTVQWTANGVALCTNTAAQTHPAIVSDGAGGAIVTWMDYLDYPPNIYAQRISADGAVMWTANGVALCNATGWQAVPTIVRDDAGGAIVAWGDERSNESDIYAQRISAGGVVQWTANGVALCTAVGAQTYPTITSDGAGGAIVTWKDARSGLADTDIYARRISAAGVVQWTANGVALCSATGLQGNPAIVSDGAGGVIVTWVDNRTGDLNDDIYAQRISAAGVVQWTANGVALCTASGPQGIPNLILDGEGGAIVTWIDDRNATAFDIYAQRLTAAGTVEWPADGVALCEAPRSQTNPCITSDGAGGAIVAWEDGRNSNSDIYAQRVWKDGATPVQLSLVSAEARPDRVRLTWYSAAGDAVTATVYRRTATSDWNAVAGIIGDGAGRLVYEDNEVSAGTRYGYRLGVLQGEGEEFHGEAWVDVPSEPRFALVGPRPNPAAEDVSIAFSLPDASPARLELMDIAGRRVAVREVGALGPGDHVVGLARGHTIPAGVYLLRLSRGGQSLSARVLILR